MNTSKNNTLLRTIAVLTGIVLFVLAGVGVTGAAANGSIPGDTLYPVKTTLEQTRLSLAQDAGDRAQMKIAFAAQHLEEINALVKDGRYGEIRQTVVEFETDINGALLELETVSKTDPARATAIAGNVSLALTRYAQILSDLSTTAPDAVKSEVNRALDTTQIAGGLNQSNSKDDHGTDNSSNNANAKDDFGRDDSVNKTSQDDNSNAANSSDSYEYVGKINMKTSDSSSNDASLNDTPSRDDSLKGNTTDKSSKDTRVDDSKHGSDDRNSGNTTSGSHDSSSTDTSSHDSTSHDSSSNDSGSSDSGSHD